MTEERIHQREGTPAEGIALKVDVTTVPAKESVELLDGGDRAYPAMLSAIAHARTSVDLEVYAFEGEDASGTGFEVRPGHVISRTCVTEAAHKHRADQFFGNAKLRWRGDLFG